MELMIKGNPEREETELHWGTVTTSSFLSACGLAVQHLHVPELQRRASKKDKF
jgi:hypothetical protein